MDAGLERASGSYEARAVLVAQRALLGDGEPRSDHLGLAFDRQPAHERAAVDVAVLHHLGECHLALGVEPALLDPTSF